MHWQTASDGEVSSCSISSRSSSPHRFTADGPQTDARFATVLYELSHGGAAQSIKLLLQRRSVTTECALVNSGTLKTGRAIRSVLQWGGGARFSPRQLGCLLMVIVSLYNGVIVLCW